jgi:hypothetical protein
MINVSIDEREAQAEEEEIVDDTPYYPRIKKYFDGCVVLFVAPDTGVCLLPGIAELGEAKVKVGEFTNQWNEDDFEAVDGVVILSNSEVE